MAYQLFSKAHQPKNQTSTTPPTQNPYNDRYRPPIHPPPPLPPSAVPASKPPASNGDTAIEPTPYPYPTPSGYPTPHPHITIETVNTAHIPSLTRITGLLLPIRYPNSFYTATVMDPVISSLSRVAIYHDHPVAESATSTPSLKASPAAGSARNIGADKVIGGIRCRLERLPQTTAELLRISQLHGNLTQEPTNLYIQTLHLLSPYRGNGVAASLLNALLYATPPGHSSASRTGEGGGAGHQVSRLVKHYNIRYVTAHVHEANDEGLKWYMARGFQVEDGVIEKYYRRLNPSGARIVKLALQWKDDDEDDEGISGLKNGGEEQNKEESPYDGDEEDWEKVEAEDEDEKQDHGVRPFTDSRILDVDEGGSRKRKAEEEPL
ncbi:GNAT family N-acetyltransferase [Aspergillus ruber CBS 135680]|uniref:N-acetyltransferase domain-containing protein n=1 Tax=Aspergillus ruber (strain CBS 135680) TaxID=1388766 RepID=A0A017S7Z8_ASPRC|nr:uncharacterized protein EURHEDRAFT_414728 [Aspergillus ruber CBS 135680]EYE93158.1 hypothetical protein EURHEDRAFT_414728 [Aspergillus ruber CBS 135680]